MQPKNVASIALLLFVGASIVVLAVNGLRPADQPPAVSGSGPVESEAAAPISDGVMVYYFHNNTRCPTCRSIEQYAREAIASGFAGELKDGTVAWRVVNYETPGNEHYATDYQIVAPTVVLVKLEGGRQKQWENLMRVWELVGERDAFVEYVQAEAHALTQGS